MWLKRLTWFAVFLAAIVVALGAYTRLKDAGLGCPDWPGCYGQLFVPSADHSIAKANIDYPHRPLEPTKAWAEMVHRYFASSLGLVILVILALSIKAQKQNPSPPLKLPLLLSILVIFQGLLGMWTVTMGLFPTVVMAHLLGGFTTLNLLFLLALRLRRNQATQVKTPAEPLFKWGLLVMAIVALQIALGGWTAANYSATVCTELPICQPGWQQHINLTQAFTFWGHDFNDYEYATHLGSDAKITIHVSHRIGAMVTTIAIILLLITIHRRCSTPAIKRATLPVFITLLVQLSLGVANIILQLPLPIAVAHNLVAALLMMSLIFLNTRLYWSGVTKHDTSHRQPEPALSIQ